MRIPKGEIPNIGPWRKGEVVADEKIGSGFESDDIQEGTGEGAESGGVRRKMFLTGEGVHNLVEKPIKDKQEAKRVYGIYDRMRQAGLPVVNLLKVIREKAGSEVQYKLAMEDLTSGGSLEVLDLSPGYGDSPGTKRIIGQYSKAEELRAGMVRALAVLHNNGIVDFHPGISISLRRDLATQELVDFKVIDYSNFTGKALPRGWQPREVDLQYECDHDLEVLLSSVAESEEDRVALKAVYKKIRDDKEMHY